MNDSNDLDKAVATAARFIGYQPRSAAEVRKRLERDRFNTETITAVLELFTQHGHINELDYTLMFIADKMRVSKYGKARIIHGLRQKGVPPSVIDEAYIAIHNAPQKHIEADSLEDAELENASQLLAQKYRNENLAEPVTLKKAADFLARRGYSRDVISRCIKNSL